MDNFKVDDFKEKTIVTFFFDILKLIGVVMALFLVVSCVCGFCIEQSIIQNCHEGIVVGKQIVNPSSFCDVRYEIIFEVTYEFCDETKTAKRVVCVGEGTYLAYNVGDVFDSYSYRTSVSQSDC